MKKLILISVVVLLAACTENIKYTVKAGKHRSCNKVTFLKNDAISYSFTTDSTWVWQTPLLNGWSKVVGIAWNSNHKNSVRVVYMRSNGIGVLGY